jgi:catechol 2,3-dioxygenase-like lactoylglutathione lyase family enzyme
MNMALDHVSLHVSDYDSAKEFYSKALASLGYTIGMEMTE